jgi:hypothetical protein
MFAYAIDAGRGLAVMLFSGGVNQGDHRASGRALAEFDARTSEEIPAVIVVDEAREVVFPSKRCELPSAAPATRTTLIALVMPQERGALSIVTWLVGGRYVMFPAPNFAEAVAWIEQRRGAALGPFFEWLMDDVRSAAGPETERDT